jgi:hypothetical protein
MVPSYANAWVLFFISEYRLGLDVQVWVWHYYVAKICAKVSAECCFMF